MRDTMLAGGPIARRAWTRVAGAGLIATALAGSAFAQAPPAAPPRPAASAPAAAPQSRPAASTPQERAADIKSRGEKVRDAIRTAGAAEQTIKFECQFDPASPSCQGSGWVGNKLEVVNDRRPGVKGFHVLFWVPERGADKYRADRERFVQEQMKTNQEWDLARLNAQALFVSQKYYNRDFTYKDIGPPHAKVNGELMVCDVKVSIIAEAMASQTIKGPDGRPDPKSTEAGARALGAQIQQEVKALAQALLPAVAQASSCGPVEEAIAIPDLPLVIPAAELEGTLKPTLVARKTEVLQQTDIGKKERAKRTARGEDVQQLDTLRFLVNWHTENRGALDAEERARGSAEKFFELLALAYARMADAERAQVENGLLNRALALRRYRTVQRGLMRAKAGLGTITTTKDLETYYTAVSRANWAEAELTSLVRMADPINKIRISLYGNYDVWELGSSQPNPQKTAAIEVMRRRHIETLVDRGIVTVLGSEAQSEVLLEARKDRLFGLRDLWGAPGAEQAEAQKQVLTIWNRLGGLTGQLFSSGFGLFDVAAGVGADLSRGLYNLPGVGGQLQSRAEKLEKQSMENWDKTQWKIVMLRLMRAKAPADLRALGEQAVRLGRIDPAAAAQAIGKADGTAEIQALLEDRTFVDATDGGLHRMLGAALVDLPQRGRMELMIAWEKTRLVRRDMEAALRVDQGQDPDTGDLTWGTILSPTGWMDVATKNKGVFWQKEGDDFRQRGAQINLKSQQGLDMTKLVAPLVQVDFDFEALPAEAMARHLQLWQGSGPYIAFVQRMREDRRARYLHAWRRGIPETVQGLPATAIAQTQSLRKFYEEQLTEITQTERLSEQRRIMDLAYADYVYAWDLSGALAVARALQADPLYAQRYKLLVQTLYVDRVKQQIGSTVRNVGDIGFTTALMALTPAAGAQPASFGRFAYEAINPFAAAKGATWAQTAAHSTRAVLTQSLTEILVTDFGVPAAGQKQEALLSQLVNLALSVGPNALARLAEKIKALNPEQRVAEGVVSEQQRTPELDAKRYLAEILARELMKAIADVQASGERVARAKDLEARTSFARQARESTRLLLEGAEVRALAQRVQAARAALATAREQTAAAAKLVETQRALESGLLPPTREFYEAHLRNHPGEYFDPTRGRDIERLRSDFKKIRQMTRPEDRPALAQLEARIDQERVTRFNRALEMFLASHSAQIEGVILNGTREGNPEYKGIFSDRDFTVVTKAGVSEAAIRKELDLAFAKHGIVLNGQGRLASADIEAMVQDALPGDVRPITTWREFETWALTRVNDPHRYLSGGGAEWVGLYNYLNGATVSLQGGKLVTDATPNPKLLPAPELHPWLAWGLVLDLARFDAIVTPAELTDARSLADLIGARAKEVVRYSDALIWALHPDLLRARSPEAAKQRGYHNLLLDDVRRLAADGQITEREYALLQRLVDVKTGKSIYQAFGIEPSAAEANRAMLEATLADMDALVRRVSATTRQVYVEWLQRFARGVEDSERGPPALQTVAFRNWNAARKVDPQKLAVLMGDTSGDPLARMRRDEQAMIGTGARLDTFDPAAQLGNSIREIHTPRPGNRERPAEGTEPYAPPTALRTAAAPVRPPAQVPPLAELFVPKDSRAYTFRGDGHAYAAGQRVGTVKIPKGQSPFELVNEVVAFKLGRLLDANIPYAERVRRDDGRVTLVTPDVPGVPLNAVLAGKDALGRPVPPPPAGLGPDGLKAQLRKDFLRDRLISAILGDARRDGGSFTVTPEARLVGTDHEGARPFEAQDTVGHIAEEMRKRFEGEGYGKSGSIAPQFRETDRALGVEIEQLAATWAEMKAKLLDDKGALRRDVLEPLADYYGADKTKVLKAWQRRIRAMDTILGRVYLPNRRLPALDMGKDQFHANESAQRELFVAAKWMRDAQQSMAQGLLEDIGAPTTSAYALLKREDFASFRDGIVEKVERKKYASVAEMDDIARGRFNLPDADAVRRIVLEVEKAELFELVGGKAQGPKDREGVKFGYPRYHAILRDKRTGLTFEWQIGTRMTTEFFERPGIDLHGVKLKDGMKPNIHDIEYDVFFYMQKSDVKKNQDLAVAVGIPEFRKKVAQFAERTFLEAGTMPAPEFDRQMSALHAEASDILKRIIAAESVEYVEHFFH